VGFEEEDEVSVEQTAEAYCAVWRLLLCLAKQYAIVPDYIRAV